MNLTSQQHRAPIFLLEDDPEEVVFFRNALDELQVTNQLHVFTTKDEFVSYINAHKFFCSSAQADGNMPGLVILDHHVCCDGNLSMMRSLKAHNDLGSVPVVMFSGHTACSHVETCYAEGCNRCFIKPMDQDAYSNLLGVIFSYWLKISLNASQYTDA